MANQVSVSEDVEYIYIELALVLDGCPIAVRHCAPLNELPDFLRGVQPLTQDKSDENGKIVCCFNLWPDMLDYTVDGNFEGPAIANIQLPRTMPVVQELLRLLRNLCGQKGEQSSRPEEQSSQPEELRVLCEYCRSSYDPDDEGLWCPHHDGKPLPCPRCNISADVFLDIPRWSFSGPPCSSCVRESIMDGTTWYCLTHSHAIASEGSAGLYEHGECDVLTETGPVRQALERMVPALTTCAAWRAEGR